LARQKRIPLASGVLVSDEDFVHGQLEVSVVGYKVVEIVVNQKPYGGRSNIKLSITKKGLSSMIAILQEAAEKLEQYWLSEFATEEVKATN